jgi:hypothetical protein
MRSMTEALAKAIQTFQAAPRPPLPDEGVAARDGIARVIKKFEEDVATWTAGMVVCRSALEGMFRDLATLKSDRLVEEALRSIGSFIEAVDRDIETERLAIEQSDLRSRQAVADVRKKSSDNAHFAQKMLKRVREAWVAQHNTKVDLYYFLLALRAEYDPDARGGPTFDDPEALGRYLREHAAT